MSRPEAEKLDLLAASSNRKAADEGGISTARLADGLAALLRRLAVQPEGIAVAHAAAGSPPDQPLIRFICKNEAGQPGAFIEMPSHLFERLFVQIYGGDRVDARADKPGEAQSRFALRLGNRLCEWLVGALPGAEEPSFTQSEARFGVDVEGFDPVVVEAPITFEFDIALTTGATWTMRVYVASDLIASRDAQPKQRQQSISRAERENRILSHTGRVPLLARSEIAIAQMPASRLLALQPGDVLPITMPVSIPMLVGERPFANACMGEWQGSVALRIETLHESSPA
ncbi:FliM/FliN family flagellar motor switch protein [uncultured Sphingorhabdus sp.]|uniref:FliM/FliN family flagellar motor switch protein n=1 Tax=uncultured Sphingorhabdus sp. TaxID=1686106 RepID=UPI0026212741|nr:FliM/FliN family flagellar motor switch protein [uncultured Sphingorhabdus sp.]HMS19827.1 FliM/FliN family flagellar motor switch protein [Sphingorhabdus sp.]